MTRILLAHSLLFYIVNVPKPIILTPGWISRITGIHIYTISGLCWNTLWKTKTVFPARVVEITATFPGTIYRNVRQNIHWTIRVIYISKSSKKCPMKICFNFKVLHTRDLSRSRYWHGYKRRMWIYVLAIYVLHRLFTAHLVLKWYSRVLSEQIFGCTQMFQNETKPREYLSLFMSEGKLHFIVLELLKYITIVERKLVVLMKYVTQELCEENYNPKTKMLLQWFIWLSPPLKFIICSQFHILCFAWRTQDIGPRMELWRSTLGMLK